MTTATRQLEQAAVTLAENGYHVFPCRPGQKTPLTQHGFKDATRDERQILTWWDRTPEANIGIACGASGIVVLDIDSKSGANPSDVLRDRDLHGAPLVLTGTAPANDTEHPNSLTGVRGAQVYFRGQLPTGPLSIDGCEIRGAGAYVVAPPSLHPSGVKYTGQLPGTHRLPETPDWLLELTTSASRNGAGPAAPVDDTITAGARNQALASIAGSMRRRGMDADEIAGALHVANTKRCRPPLPADEVDRIAASIARYEPAQAVNGSRERHVMGGDKTSSLAALTELLDLPSVGLQVQRARIVGRGATASADLHLTDGTVIAFETLRDVGTPSRLMVEVTACTGAKPKLKGPQAQDALALLHEVAEHTEAASLDDLTVDWCRGYLQAADVLDVDMNDQAYRWAAFSHLKDSNDTEERPGVAGTVLRHTDGTMYVRTGWFRSYVKGTHDHTVSPREIASRVARLGWTRKGSRGAIKATQPGGHGVEIWSFYTVPAGWEDDYQ